MSNNISRLGQINGQGDPMALFIKQVKADVLTYYTEKAIMLDKVLVQTITSGSGMKFPKTGKVAAGYQTIGEDINTQKVSNNEVVINIDGKLYAAVELDDLDLAMASHDYMSIYSKQLGEELAAYESRNLICEVVKGSRSLGDIDLQGATTPTYDNPGLYVENEAFASATAATKGDALIDALFDAQVAMDNANVPEEDRYALFNPTEYGAMFKGTSKDLINKELGGDGSMSKGVVNTCAGFILLKSPQLVRSANPVDNAFHNVNTTNTYGIAWHKSAIGHVKAVELNVKTFDMPKGISTLVRAWQAAGSAFLRPEACLEFTSSRE